MPFFYLPWVWHSSALASYAPDIWICSFPFPQCIAQPQLVLYKYRVPEKVVHKEFFNVSSIYPPMNVLLFRVFFLWKVRSVSLFWVQNHFWLIWGWREIMFSILHFYPTDLSIKRNKKSWFFRFHSNNEIMTAVFDVRVQKVIQANGGYIERKWNKENRRKTSRYLW